MVVRQLPGTTARRRRIRWAEQERRLYWWHCWRSESFDSEVKSWTPKPPSTLLAETNDNRKPFVWAADPDRSFAAGQTRVANAGFDLLGLIADEIDIGA